MNKKYIAYHLHEVEDEIAHHLNLAWNGRNADENPSPADVLKWTQFPTDISLE
ncbi:MAG: hypothetical protein H7177_03220 [Rhizobacter sp.]|nr:hypothetical protein [Bacteriovorax sp.]